MEQLIITLEGKTNADLLMRLLNKFSFVKSVSRSKTPSANATNVANEAATEYNWTNPTRPATDKEFEQMLNECEAEYEAGLGLPLEEARELTIKQLAEWRKQKRK